MREHGDAAPSSEAPAHSGNDRNHCALTGLAAMAVPDLRRAAGGAMTARRRHRHPHRLRARQRRLRAWVRAHAAPSAHPGLSLSLR